MTSIRTMQELLFSGKKALVRVDFNVPLNPDGTISDDMRIREALPTIQHILKQGGTVILMSHLGRPKGKKDPKFSLAPCAKTLASLLKQEVKFAPDCIGPEVEKLVNTLKAGDVLLLENLRFYPAEEDPVSSPEFVAQLAKLGDVYINDAFGTAHRAHASTAAIAHFFPKAAAAGLLMQKEIAFLGSALGHPKRPFFTIIGGAKVSSKIGVLKSLLEKVDGLFIGGGMAFTFFKAQEIPIGASLCEEDQIGVAQDFLKAAHQKKVPLWFPVDLIIAQAFQANAEAETIPVGSDIPKGWMGLDIGPNTIATWKRELQKAATVFWNGPLGVFEFPRFAKGTFEIAQILADLKATTIVGGGDSVAAVNALELAPHFSHVSTGGGASLEYLELGHLPGIDVLKK